MSREIMKGHIPKLSIESVERLSTGDLHELCEAAEAAIMSGGGFGWLSPPPKSVMEDYWRGVLMIPERHLIVARLDKVIAGSCQILRPPRNNEALAKSEGFSMINLDVRSTQDRAIQSFEARGFTRYATNDFYARVNGDFVSGFYYRKELK